MTDDIVTRLREHSTYCDCDDAQFDMTEAADEIERLRKDLHDRGNQLVATQMEVSEATIIIGELLTCVDAIAIEGLLELSGDFRHAWKVMGYEQN